ncbi:hypothetical protein [Actinomadura physcomitrii]|uniref:hypothetical protein n=1 Tax=Actinomadura physcomitrii TaxID=2650748 RepID=UPI0019236BE7|nr:hypothetical protein [Actinomadura physcomitrii]
MDEFADPRRVAEPARRAEAAGWDGFFVWDHAVFPRRPAAHRGRPAAVNHPRRRPAARAAVDVSR